MMITLENEVISLAVNTMGAELSSLRAKADGTEYIWQADGRWWGRHAPVLFPFIGQSKDKGYSYEGQSYPMGNHGFARNYEFTVTQQTKTAVTLELCDNEATRAVYPFAFKLALTYALDGGKVNITHTVSNPAADDMLYYSVGAHPGFNVPLAEGEVFEEYRISFEPAKRARCYRLHDTVDFLLDDNLTEQTVLNDILLQHEMFSKGLIAFDYEGDVTCRLYSAKTGRGVAVHTQGMEQLCLWSPEKPAPFVCVEPWSGLPDFMSASGQLKSKAKINSLAAGQSAQCGYSIEVLK